jgi:nitrite reductase/ring-hydroxylating ferredoxin subunit
MPDPTSPAADHDHACGACGISRRGFLSATAVAMIASLLEACGGDAGVTGPVGPAPNPRTPPAGVSVSGNTITVDLTAATSLTGTPGFVVAFGAARPALIIRSGATYVAYDARCPHAGTATAWSIPGANVRCNNHGSEFRISDGALQVGPANTGLRVLPLTRTGDTLSIDAS